MQTTKKLPTTILTKKSTMFLSRERIYQVLEKTTTGVVVTQGQDEMNARTMFIGFNEKRGIYLFTLKSTDKMDDIQAHPNGLIHISTIEEDLNQSYDISLKGTFKPIVPGFAEYFEGIDALSKANPRVKEILNSDDGGEFQMLLFKISQIKGWSYFQAVNGMGKTVFAHQDA